jgi:sugar lactone lactonase YvrE
VILKKNLLLLSLLVTCGLSAAEESADIATPEFNRDATQSFFEPRVGTHNIVYAANHLPLVFWGTPFESDLIVASDIGTNITRYSEDGKILWRVVTYPKTVRAIDIRKGRLIAHAERDKLTIDIGSGEILKTEPDQQIYLFDKISSGVRVSGLDATGKGTVFVDQKKLPYKTQWARDALVANGKLYVSDTFGQRVAIFDLKTLKLIDEKRFYYPNDLFLIKGRVMVVEEHGNRIVDVESNNVFFSCPLWAYTQTKKPVEEIEKQTTKYNSNEKVGRCAREFMGQNTLYSANGAISAKKTVIVADTDNHRIIAIKNGEVVSELINTNNPVRVLLTPPLPRVDQALDQNLVTGLKE